MMRNSDGAPVYSSFIINDDDDNLLIEDDDQRTPKERKLKQSEKQRMTQFLMAATYTLEKLRFVIDKSIYPRDMTLKQLD